MAVVRNLEQLALNNSSYLSVIETDFWGQVTIMCLVEGEDIPPEVHTDTTQITVIVVGTGELRLKNEIKDFKSGDFIIIPPDTYHHFVNTGQEALRLYTYYTHTEHELDEFLDEQPY